MVVKERTKIEDMKNSSHSVWPEIKMRLRNSIEILCRIITAKRTEMDGDYTIENNENQQRFEIQIGNEVAFMEYKFYENSIALMHTLAPESLGGKGLASALAAYAFQYATDNQKPVMVYCPFVATYVKRHPEVLPLLDKVFHKTL